MTDLKKSSQEVSKAFWKDDPYPLDVGNLEISYALLEAVNQILPEEEPIYKGGMRTGYDKTWRETKQDERQRIRTLFLELCDEIKDCYKNQIEREKEQIKQNLKVSLKNYD
jgi:hypothetical protein